MKQLQHPQIIPTFTPLPITEEDIKKYLYKMPRHNIEIVFFGSDPWSIYVLQTLEDNFDVKTVVTAPNSAVAKYFKGLVLNHTTNYQLLTTDLYVVASYGKIIPKKLLDIPRYGSLNVHPSLLPKYRGASPIQQAILNEEKISGITIIKMDEEIDHGPVLYQERLELSDRDNFDILSKKMFQRASEILPQIIKDFVAGKITPKPQDHSKATFCPLLTRESGFLDIDNPPEKLDRMIRAYFPWPGVWCKWKGKIVKFLPNNMLQMEGKKVISIKDFLNGYPDFPIKSITLDKK
ncbi:MAG: methionyl-tRNA formyltransferase [Candidatus Daviesbacteria bacterium]|nr:methionyl-tRNA formyltransferase [Candidatus Daviesbacteria bacterium]